VTPAGPVSGRPSAAAGELWGLDLTSMATWVVVLTVVALVFVESGVLIGFLLPGDSLLFAAGLLVADRADPGWLVALAAGVFVAAVSGVAVGYWTGLRLGRPWLERRSERMASHLQRAEEFYRRWGWWALVIARFIPWLRTFTPIVAGIARMPLRRLVSANVVGAAVWGPGLVLMGYVAHTQPAVRVVAYVIAGTAIALSVLVPLGGWLLRRLRRTPSA
jgi:membrane-associated protein